MYGIYDGIIEAGKSALFGFDETEELLEYPEVQADKAYYLSVLSKYNKLKAIKDKLFALISALEEEKSTAALLPETNDFEERSAIYEEISALKKKASQISAALSDELGCRHIEERAYCRFKLKAGSARIGAALSQSIKAYLLSRGVKVEEEKTSYSNDGYAREISFIAVGEDVIARLTPLVGAHKVYTAQARSEELCFAVTPSAEERAEDEDFKIDVFHSSGAGGQNVNKVETAVRVTHLPTGLTIVCQDERSQLRNKQRALETIRSRLKETFEKEEKKRIEADICAQYSIRNTPISFDAANNTATDKRTKAFLRVPFPFTDEQFASYMDALITI